LLRRTAPRPNRLTHDEARRMTVNSPRPEMLREALREELVAETEHRKNERITAQTPPRLVHGCL